MSVWDSGPWVLKTLAAVLVPPPVAPPVPKRGLVRVFAGLKALAAAALAWYQAQEKAQWVKVKVSTVRADTKMRNRAVKVLRAWDAVDASLDRIGGIRFWVPHPAIIEALRKELYWRIERNAWPQEGHSKRARIVFRKPGRPKKGEQVGTRHYCRGPGHPTAAP